MVFFFLDHVRKKENSHDEIQLEESRLFCIQRHAFNCNVFLLGRCWHKERALKKNENIQTMVKLDEIRSWEMKSFNKTSLQIQFGC